jgi:hypothetical protein
MLIDATATGFLALEMSLESRRRTGRTTTIRTRRAQGEDRLSCVRAPAATGQAVTAAIVSHARTQTVDDAAREFAERR